MPILIAYACCSTGHAASYLWDWVRLGSHFWTAFLLHFFYELFFADDRTLVTIMSLLCIFVFISVHVSSKLSYYRPLIHSYLFSVTTSTRIQHIALLRV